jgi:hypothetical protein
MTALEIIETVEILNQEQYEIVNSYDPELCCYLHNIGPDYHTKEMRWLNSNVYSEADKEEYDLQKEIGF